MRFVLGVVQYFDFTWEDIDEEEIGFHTKARLIEIFRDGLVRAVMVGKSTLVELLVYQFGNIRMHTVLQFPT